MATLRPRPDRGRAIPAVAVTAIVGVALGYALLSPALAGIGLVRPAARLAPGNATVQRQAARLGVVLGQPVPAHRAAARALASAPVDQSSTAILALTGTQDRLAPLMNEAAALGWRDYPTQLWLAQAAGESAVGEVWAQRADALARQNDAGAIHVLIDQYLPAAWAQAAMGERVRLQPEWAEQYYRTPIGSPAIARARVAMLGMQAAAAPPAERRRLADALFSSLDRAGALGLARQVWRQFAATPSLARGLVFDPTLRRVATDRGTFSAEWQVPAGAPGYAEPVADGGMRMTHDGRRAGTLLLQAVRLTPQMPMRLTVDLVPGEGRADAAALIAREGFAVGIACRNSKPVELSPRAAANGRRMQAMFTVPAGCTDQWLAVDAVAGGTSQSRSIDLRRISIEPAANPA